MAAEITNVSPHGFWLLLDGREIFAAFQHFPWFRHASIDELTRVERPSAGHLSWPLLDVDLAVESLEHPERYPLVSLEDVARRARPAASVRERKATYGTGRHATAMPSKGRRKR